MKLPLGVHKTKQGRYRAEIRRGGRSYYAGIFDTIAEAAAAVAPLIAANPIVSRGGRPTGLPPSPVDPCDRCGDPAGKAIKESRRPARFSAVRFGLDGMICRTCYSRLADAVRYQNAKKTKPKPDDLHQGKIQERARRTLTAYEDASRRIRSIPRSHPGYPSARSEADRLMREAVAALKACSPLGRVPLLAGEWVWLVDAVGELVRLGKPTANGNRTRPEPETANLSSQSASPSEPVTP